MAYDSLKALIRQYIKTNGEQEITGQILQNVLVEMVNQYPSTDGFATQSWVTSQLAGYATTSQLADYLPLTGGTLTGDLAVLNHSLSVVTAGSSATSYTTTIYGSGVEVQMLRSGTPTNYRAVLNENGLTLYDQNVAGTTITRSSVTSGSFIKSGGTSAQFLKADGSVDSNTYLTSASLADYLPLTGGTLTGDLYLTNGKKINIILIEGRRIVSLNLGYSQINDTEYAWNMYVGSALDVSAGLDMDGVFVGSGFKKIDGTSSQFLKADGSVDSNTYLTSASLAGYLPLTGGTLTGDLAVLNHSLSVVTAGSSATSYTTTIYGSGVEVQMLRSGTPTNYRAVLNENGLTFYDHNDAGTTITLSSVTSGSFVKSGGTSAQFLKADGSVDSNTYITASALTGYATQSWVTTQLGSYNPTANFKTINNQSIIGTGNINIEGGGTVYDAEVEYLESTGTQWIDTGYIPNSNTELTIQFAIKKFNTNLSNASTPFGARIGWQNTQYTLFFPVNQTNSIRLCYGNAVDELTHSVGLNNIYVCNINKNTWTITENGSLIYTYTFNSAQSNNLPNLSLYLFLFNENNQVFTNDNQLLIYNCTIKENGQTILDFIPVRVGNVGYLYDKVSGELFGNSGTGSFVLGQDTGPGGGLPYLPLTGGTITGNLTVNGAVKFNSNLTFAYNKGIYFGTDNLIRIVRDNSRLLIVDETSSDIIIGDYDSRNYTSFVNDLQGGLCDTYYNFSNVTWYIFRDGTAQFRSVSQTSDLRKKTIIGDVPMNIYNVANAPLFKFTWKDEKEYSGQHIGSAAQYWQTVLPELVSIGRDADMTLAMQYDVIALASAITVAKTVVNHEERIILLERENEALKKEIADLKSA